jgi:hypothetical protein
MADTQRTPLTGHGPRTQCERCQAHDQAVPLEEELRRMVSGENLDDEAFEPRAMTPEQAAAARMVTFALGPYIRAFGLRTAGARLAVTVACLRAGAKYALVQQRILEARKAIEDDLRQRYERGEIAAAEADQIALNTPTPDYPGKSEDDAWLARGAQ